MDCKEPSCQHFEEATGRFIDDLKHQVGIQEVRDPSIQPKRYRQRETPAE